MIETETVSMLTNIVGAENISDDIVIRQAYSRDPHPSVTVRKLKRDYLTIPDLVIMPGSSDDVRAIYDVSNRYNLNVIPMGSGDNLIGYCIPSRSRTLIMDLKRLNSIIHIDVENKYIRMQPWVCYSRVQTETMPLGLWNGGTPAAPATNNIISNCLTFGGDWQTALAYGMGIRGILGCTIVLPTGDILKTGSHGVKSGDGTYWYGPGPDLKGLFELGAFGGLGTITEVLYKLHTWAGGDWPEETDYGHPPLPDNHRVFWYRFDRPEDIIRAGREVGYAGIGIGLNLTMRSVNALVGESHQEDTLRRYDEGFYEPHWMYVMCAGFSPGQLDYEESVIDEIMLECYGEKLDADRRAHMDTYNMDCFRSGDFVRWIRHGIYAITGLGRGPIELMKRVHAMNQAVVEKYDVPNTNSSWPWYYAFDRGYFWADERDLYGDQLDHAATISKMTVDVFKNTTQNPSGYWVLNEPMGAWFGDTIGPDFPSMVRMVKRVFDPNDIANPDKLSFVRPPERRKEA